MLSRPLLPVQYIATLSSIMTRRDTSTNAPDSRYTGSGCVPSQMLSQNGAATNSDARAKRAVKATVHISWYLSSRYLGSCLFKAIVRRYSSPASFRRSAFSAIWSWSMHSCMSPSIKAGRLYIDQFILWSVTRPWG